MNNYVKNILKTAAFLILGLITIGIALVCGTIAVIVIVEYNELLVALSEIWYAIIFFVCGVSLTYGVGYCVAYMFGFVKTEESTDE